MLDLEKITKTLTKWVKRRFPTLDLPSSQDIASVTVATLFSKYGHISDTSEWLKLGYTISERRAKDLLRSPTHREVPLDEADAAADRMPDPLTVMCQRDLVRRVLRSGIKAARSEMELFLWDEWANRVMRGEQINLQELSKSIWPEMHHSHASRTLARLLKDIEREFAGEF